MPSSTACKAAPPQRRTCSSNTSAFPPSRRSSGCAGVAEIGVHRKVQLIVSGGIRSGADVAKAIAIGADAVAIGTHAVDSSRSYVTVGPSSLEVVIALDDFTLTEPRFDSSIEISAFEFRPPVPEPGQKLYPNQVCS